MAFATTFPANVIVQRVGLAHYVKTIVRKGNTAMSVNQNAVVKTAVHVIQQTVHAFVRRVGRVMFVGIDVHLDFGALSARKLVIVIMGRLVITLLGNVNVNLAS